MIGTSKNFRGSVEVKYEGMPVSAAAGVSKVINEALGALEQLQAEHGAESVGSLAESRAFEESSR